MKLINPSVEIWKPAQTNSIVDCLKHIERCGRICYKSEDKITNDSYKKFLDMLLRNEHRSVLEHGTGYFTFPVGSPVYDLKYLKKMDITTFFKNNPYSTVNERTYTTVREAPGEFKEFVEENGATTVYYVTTNARVVAEKDLEDKDAKIPFSDVIRPYFSNVPHKEHTERLTVHFTVDRGISHEFVRHRVFSFSQESTRYCNYSKGKFGGELTFINPSWMINKIDETGGDYLFIGALEAVEEDYMRLLEDGWQPQQARQILPNALKTELIMTGTVPQWKAFFDLRCKGAHPDAMYIANKLKEQFINYYTE